VGLAPSISDAALDEALKGMPYTLDQRVFISQLDTH
jgi:hypothetical protein